MKLWKISQTVCHGCDTYDSAVVDADTAEEARRIDPGSVVRLHFTALDREVHLSGSNGTWPKYANAVTVELLGEAISGTQSGVIVASFHAG